MNKNEKIKLKKFKIRNYFSFARGKHSQRNKCVLVTLSTPVLEN